MPFVTAGETDEGVSAFIGNDVTVFSEYTKTIDMLGSAKYRNYKYGGDEFIILLYNTSKNETKHYSERLRKAVKSMEWEIENNIEKITISIGISSFSEDTSDLKVLKEYANKGENEAKRMGKIE
ncbi:MAG: diguanylate cyclase [Saprospiraceae bacterium]|nr:diguanylate cyclase [Candidatus Defluviibacterium haderslevense]